MGKFNLLLELGEASFVASCTHNLGEDNGNNKDATVEQLLDVLLWASAHHALRTRKSNSTRASPAAPALVR